MKKLVLLLVLFSVSYISKAQTVLDIIVNSPDHVILEGLINDANLNATFSDTNPLTVFAPTDGAFGNLPGGVLQAMIDDPDGLLTQVLTYHATQNNLFASNLFQGQQIFTINGSTLDVTVNSSGIFINDALIIIEDIIASNGVVHVIDAVLLPPQTTNTVFDVIANSPDHTILESALIAANLEEALRLGGPFMVFAPTDAAWNDFPPGVLEALLADPAGELSQILLYHLSAEVLNTSSFFNQLSVSTLHGDSVLVTITSLGIFIDDAQIIISNIQADNGIVHVIGGMLQPTAVNGTVREIIMNSPNHIVFESLLEYANLLENLQGPASYTVFAPTDDAFDALPDGFIETLLADQTGALVNLLLYHETSSVILSEDFVQGQTISMLNGNTVLVTVNNQGIFINNARIITEDIIASNGVVHVLDAVLIPPSPGNNIFDIISNTQTLSILEQAIISAGLVPVFEGAGPLTVFAPTNNAFNALPPGVLADLIADPTGALAQLLLYHASEGETLTSEMASGLNLLTLQGQTVTVTVNGQSIFINNARITVADIIADNGVVHIINAVLIPPPPSNKIFDIIKNSPQHSILEFIITAAGYADELSGNAPFTVFAPTDAAFDALPAGFITELLDDPTGELLQILLYHTLNGSRLTSNMSNGQNIVTLNGASVTITINDLGVFVNDAMITVANIIADNGMVHVIDAVLMIPPPAPVTVLDLIVASPLHTTFEAFIIAAGLTQQLSGTNQITVFAPTDAAFSALSPALINELVSDPTGVLAEVILYHLVGNRVPSNQMLNGSQLVTLNSQTVDVTVNAQGIFINNARITIADAPADNGLVHYINAVLLPENTLNAKNLDDVYPEVKIFPNPVSSELTIDLTGLDKPVNEVRIIDISGKTVLAERVQTNQVQRINIEELTSGLYFVEMVIENEVYITKLMVQR
ncbi:MAG: fasciclin domain-containing protein [Saprospiraceae bacterium]|nr:fasciclin domain-containing protein [Saprospiraceae bacterium]